MEEFIKTLSEEQKQALLKALSDNKPTTEQSEQTTIKKHISNSQSQNFITETKPKIQNQQRREPVRGRGNEWVDTGEGRDIFTPETERTPRKRPPPVKQMVECHACGKTFKADKRFIYGEYVRCDRCVGKKR
jgi:formylmethanofuran dehydrogenase subunit E